MYDIFKKNEPTPLFLPSNPNITLYITFIEKSEGKKPDKTVSEAKHAVMFQFENKHPLFMYFFT